MSNFKIKPIDKIFDFLSRFARFSISRTMMRKKEHIHEFSISVLQFVTNKKNLKQNRAWFICKNALLGRNNLCT